MKSHVHARRTRGTTIYWGGQQERDLITEIWAHADRKSFYGVKAFVLSEEWEFLCLTLHATRHGRSSFKDC
jgi:hypothetical protein